jgi:hypothetical protein
LIQVHLDLPVAIKDNAVFLSKKISAKLVMLPRDHVLLDRQHAKVELLKVVSQYKHTANQKGTKDGRSN